MSFTNRTRFTGMSGLDINDMVTQLMRGHSMRLDRLTQSREIFSWQQSLMRNVAADIRGLQDRFLNLVGPNRSNNVMLMSNFVSVTGTVTSNGTTIPGVSVAGTTTSATGTRNIQIEQAARGDSFRGGTVHNQQSIVANNRTDANGDPVGFSFSDLVDNFRDEDGDFRNVSFDVNLNGRNVRFTMNETSFDTLIAAAQGLVNDGYQPDVETAQNVLFVESLNAWLGENFGSDTRDNAFDNPSSDPFFARRHVWAELDNNGNLSISGREGNVVTLGNAPLPSDVDQGALEVMGFNTTGPGDSTIQPTTRFDPSNRLMGDFLNNAEGQFNFTINGVNFEFDGTDFTATTAGTTATIYSAVEPGNLTLQQVMDAVNARTNTTLTFSGDSGRFTLTNPTVGAVRGGITMSETAQGMGRGFLNAIGVVDNAGNASNDPAIRTSTAQDAVVHMDGQVFIRDSNSFTIGDISLNINPDIFVDPPTSENGAPIPPPNLTITLSRDTSSTREMLLNFIEEYNTLIASIRDLTETRRPRLGAGAGGGFYMPLTDEQRRAMSDREIELWETQARTGILHRDETLRSLTRELHREIMRPVQTRAGGQISLLDVGIRTSSDLSRFGELQIDEARLDQFLDNNIDDIADLFAAASMRNDRTTEGRRARLNESGVGQRINDIMNWAINTSGGSITERAGTHAVTLEDNFLSRRIADHDRRIDLMLRDLQRREDRYFAIFGRLEAAMLQSNSQMMFMEQMFWAQ
ncbi:MAG: flagellar filament capping protein FliD [Defluviitaleaceae bacterium]|nr:flagellar filament capping protein FliD [Defluviitaleaceae bacterium]